MNEEQKHALDTALILAVVSGQKDIAKCLLKAGADIHVDGDAPLMRAAEEGRTEMVEFLLIMGANPHDNEALLRAAQHGHIETLRVLFEWADKQKGSTVKGPLRPQGPTP